MVAPLRSLARLAPGTPGLLGLLGLLALSACATEPGTAPADEGVQPGDADGDGSGEDGSDDQQDTDEDPVDDDEEVEETLEFDAVKALSRASLDLRGIRPSLDELALVQEDPAAYDALVEEYLYGEHFGDRVRELWSEIYLTRQDYYYVYAYEYGLDDEVEFAASVGEEPLQLLAYIAENDLPYTEIVTAEYTMANESLGAAFPVDRDPEAEGWVPAEYTDGRPQAGVLTMNGMWWRYMTTVSNANRGRANAISRMLLCNDYLSKPIEFDRNVNLLDQAALDDALKNNEGCVSCHSTLEPLASHFWGFYQYLYYSKMELTYYHADREHMWEEITGIAPGYYGEPTYGLRDLGQKMAADTRLIECITEQSFEVLMQREAEVSDMDTLTAFREDFLAEGLVLRSLFHDVLTSEAYKTRADADGQLNPKMLTPAQLGTALEDLTGFRFEYYGYDLLGSDSYGVRTLAGGVDGVYALKPAREPTATIALVHERVTQAAATYAVEHDASNRDAPHLFSEVEFTETPSSDRDAMARQVQLLHLRLFGNEVELDGQEVEANLDLWQDLYMVEGSKERAWAGVLSVLLRDPEFLFY